MLLLLLLLLMMKCWMTMENALRGKKKVTLSCQFLGFYTPKQFLCVCVLRSAFERETTLASLTF